jgi:hypothetical protein
MINTGISARPKSGTLFFANLLTRTQPASLSKTMALAVAL